LTQACTAKNGEAYVPSLLPTDRMDPDNL
jgi:hypothetical protein